MKVLFLSALYDPIAGWGTEVMLNTQILGLTHIGIATAVLATSEKPGLHLAKQDGVNIWLAGLLNVYWPRYNSRPGVVSRAVWHLIDVYNPLMAGYVRQVLAEERPDVVSIQTLRGWSLSAVAEVKRFNIPIVQVLHDYYLLCPKGTMFVHGVNCKQQCNLCRMLRMPHRVATNRLTAVVGVSRYILDVHQSAGYFANVPVHRVIHNVLRPAEKLAKPQRDGGVRIGFLGSITPHKGVEVLLKAFGKIADLNAELWVGGTGEEIYTEYLAKAYSSRGIRFMGRVDREVFFSSIDVVVVPSVWQEPFGLVLAEALEHGLPVIVSDRGGMPEVVVNGVNGLLFNPDSFDDLAEKLRCVVTDPTLRQRMSDAALQSGAYLADVEGYAKRFADVYYQAANLAYEGKD